MGKVKLKASWASFKTLAVIFALLLASATTRTLGSGGSECDYNDCGSFFDPALVLERDDVPWFLSEVRDSMPKDLEAVNLAEWSVYFGGAIPEDQLSSLIYRMPLQEVVDLAASFGKPLVLGPDAGGLTVSLVKYGRRDRILQALEYLAIAKRVEPIATRREETGWNTPKNAPPVSAESVQGLIAGAEGRISRADRFLAQRYRFQALRLMYYSGQYQRAQQYFERHKGSFNEENSPKYRFIDIAAGAYYKDKKYGKANYLYSLVFDKFEPLKRSAYFSFHPQEDRDWNETLSLTRNSHEREVVWQLLGIYADGQAAIEKIYQINPKSKLLPYLLVREVHKAEHAWSGNQGRFASRFGPEAPRPDAVVVGASRVQLISGIADAGKAQKPYLWQLAAGHLLALSGVSRAAERYIDLAEKAMPDDGDLRAQARMSRLFARVRAIQAIDKGAEPFLAREHSWLGERSMFRAGRLNLWSLKHLSDVYAGGADPLRSRMLTDSPQDPVYQSVAGIDSILAFVRAPANDFDRFLVQNYPYSAADLQELRALNFLYVGNFSGAVEAFTLSGLQTPDLKADPFISRIRDCHECDAAAPHPHYSKLSFAERMLELSKVAQGQGEAAAGASLELANGFYNMSYFGNGRAIYDTKNGNFRVRLPDGRYAGIAIDMDLAEKYYLQAATLSSNRELKAQAIFMAAKAEQNRANQRPEAYFAQLRSFADTRYYQEIIQECVRFKQYLGL
jgi:hypothetical protein